MSISSVNSSAASSVYTNLSSEKLSSTAKPADMTEMLEEALESSGVDEETQEAIQEELTAAIQSLMAESNGEKPDPETMRETVNSIFSEYGLDAEAMMSERFGAGGPPPMGGAPMGPPPGDVSATEESSSSEETDASSLFDYLEEDDEDEDSSSSVPQTAEELAQYIMDCLMGIDEVA